MKCEHLVTKSLDCKTHTLKVCAHCNKIMKTVSNRKAAESLHEPPTLRDQFAMVALQGLLASPVMGDAALHNCASAWVKDTAESAYDFADAMLEVRK